MTDNLVKRLRAADYWMRGDDEGLTFEDDAPFAAADHIEQLERELSNCRMAQVVMDNTVETLTDELRAARFLLRGRHHD